MDHQEPQNEQVAEVQGAEVPVVAPEAATADGESPASEGSQQQKTPSNCIQVSLEKAPPFYAHLGRRLMEKHEEIVITSLGNATNIAIGAASIMEREGAATITKVETDYYNSSRSKRRLPKITISLLKSENAPALEDNEEQVVAPEESSATTTAAAHQTVEASDAAQSTAVDAAA